MADTANLGLPLVAANQAQKHITVNTSFERLDAVAQMVLMSRVLTTPPLDPAQGSCYAVPSGASGDWAGQDGAVAMFLNGGWDFVVPYAGWRSWIADEAPTAVFDGQDWSAGALALSQSGAGPLWQVADIDHVVSAGSTSLTMPFIPGGALVHAVTGIVLTDVAAPTATFSVGIQGVSVDRYGAGIGSQSGSWLRGLTPSAVAYYADTGLSLSSQNGDFTGGTVRLVAHYMEFTLPRI